MSTTLEDGFDFVRIDIPLRFTVGQSISIDVQIVSGAGTIVNITGRTYTAKIGPDGSTSILSLTPTITDGVNGMLRLTSTATTGLTPGSYRWEVWENTDNFLWGGPVEIVAKRVL